MGLAKLDRGNLRAHDPEMGRSLATKLKTLSKLAAIAAGLAFSFQSVALPVHAAAHALQHSIQLTTPSSGSATTADSAKTNSRTFASSTHTTHLTDADCDLCDLSTHQAVSTTAIVTFDSVEPVLLRGETLPLLATFARLAHLPPVRGPPALA